jgi:hypothetical protein
MRTQTGELSLKHAYKFYKEKNPKGSKFYVDYKTYSKICYAFNKKVSERIIERGEKITLPYRLSTIRICKQKTNFERLKADFGNFRKTGDKRKMLNEHSDGFMGFFYWNKSRCLIKNKSFYRFIATRDNKRALAKRFKMEDGHKLYAEKDKSFIL